MWNNSNNSTVQNYALETENTLPAFKQGQNCVPVMLEHLKRHGEDLKIWGILARTVTFVAIVDEIEITSTKVNFKFRDETGTLKGLKWLESEISYECPVKKNSYARVYGSMRNQQNENFVLVTGIQPMKHLNEQLTHLMEVTHVCLEAEKLATSAAQNQNQAANFSSHSTTNTEPAIQNDDQGLTREQVFVKDIISRGDPENGAERKAIKSEVPSYMVTRVDEILEFLSSEGHIYTTISDDYFKLV